MNKSIYQKLRSAGCEIDNHYSDLYVKDSSTARKILKEENIKYSAFVNQIDKCIWFDIPLSYDPYWEKLEKNIAKGSNKR